MTFHYNEPGLLEWQIRAMQKFIEDDFELIVFNDASSSEIASAIKKICEKYQVICVRYEQEWHDLQPINDKIYGYLANRDIDDCIGIRSWFEGGRGLPGLRHSHVIKYALDNFGYQHDDLVVIFDGDMFPIRPVSIRALQEDYDVVGLYKFSPKRDFGYMWVPFISLNMPVLPNKSDMTFDFDIINNCLSDTGSTFMGYLRNNPQLIVKKYVSFHTNTSFNSLEEMQNAGFNPLEAELCKVLPEFPPIEFHVNHLFLHYVASSYITSGQKYKCVVDFLDKIIK